MEKYHNSTGLVNGRDIMGKVNKMLIGKEYITILIRRAVFMFTPEW